MALGQHLKQLRSKAGLSQADLAKRVGIDVTYLSKLENDRQRASERVVRSLAGALQLDPGPLLIEAGHVPSEFQVAAEPPGSWASPAGGVNGRLDTPRYRTRFIDRESDRKRLEALLRSTGSLISVTGPPGCGKTRLLAEVCGDAGTVAWVRVRENDAEGMAAALATLDPPAPGLVVVLDDADRDLQTSTRVARRLVAGGATVVATSRQALPVYGHQHLRLAPLPVPDRHQRPVLGDGPPPDLSRLRTQESVELFVDRAALARPDFVLDHETAPAVFDVCRWLDGLPLAIELAALRLSQMTVADLAARIRGLVGWLTGNTPDVPDRHSSLQAAIGWSFDQLADRQLKVATRLSVFEYTFSIEDAVSVASDDEHPREFVEATVLELVDRSLLYWREDADRRAVYRWLRPIKQYGQLLLERAEDRTHTAERYRSWVRDVVRSLDNDLPRRESEWERLADLTPELVSAIYSLPAAEQGETMRRMADALSKALQFGSFAEQVDWFSKQFSQDGPQVFREAGMAARVQGELERAHKSFEEAYNIALRTNDDVGKAHASLDLAENAVDLGLYEEADKHADRAEGLYGKLEDSRGGIEVLNLRGKRQQESGDPDGAEGLFEDALRRARAVDDTRLVAYSLHSLGVCHFLLRRISTARSVLAESLELRSKMRNHRGVARVIEVFALMESELENHALALQLLGAVRQYRQASGVLGIPPWWQRRFEALEQEARISLALTPEAVDRHLKEGRKMTLGEAGEKALRIGPALLGGELEDPVSEPLRRPIPSLYREHGQAEAVAARAQEPTKLDMAARELAASGGSATDAVRRILRSGVLALAEPLPTRTSDILCFAMAPHHYRGVIVPVFASGRALAETLHRHPEWASRPVLEIPFDQLRASLGSGETAVLNPWTDSEFRVTATELGYAPSIEAPSSTNLAASSS